MLPKKVSRIGNRLQEDCHFDPFWGSPPTLPRRARAPASWIPVIDLKSLWRSLRSFPHQRWGPQEHKPRDSMGRAAKPEQSAFSAVLGSDCSPRAKGGFAAPRHLQPPVKASANPRNPRIFGPTSKIPYLGGPPVFRLSDGSQNFRVPASASVAHGQKRRQMRPRHSHSEPDSEPPGLIFSSSAAQEVNLSTGTLRT